MSDRQTVINQLLGRERITAEHPVFLTSAAAKSVEAAQEKVLDAEAAHATEPTPDTEAAVAAAKEALEHAWASADEQLVRLQFEGLPPEVFEELIGAHQPTEEQEEKAGVTLRWNPKTFPAALIAATCTSPGFGSANEAYEVFYGPKARFSQTEAAEVFGTARLTCEGSREVADWGKGSGETAG